MRIKLNPRDLPDFDILCANIRGFYTDCQGAQIMANEIEDNIKALIELGFKVIVMGDKVRLS